MKNMGTKPKCGYLSQRVSKHVSLVSLHIQPHRLVLIAEQSLYTPELRFQTRIVANVIVVCMLNICWNSVKPISIYYELKRMHIRSYLSYLFFFFNGGPLGHAYPPLCNDNHGFHGFRDVHGVQQRHCGRMMWSILMREGTSPIFAKLSPRQQVLCLDFNLEAQLETQFDQ